MKAGVAVVDVLTGLHAAVGVLAALRAREASGRGQLVQVNLLSSLLSSMVNQAAGYTAGGAVPGILGNRHPSIAPYRGVLDRRPARRRRRRQRPAVRRLLRRAGHSRDRRPIPDSRPTPPGSPTSTPSTKRISAQLTQRPADHWFKVLSDRGVPCGPVNDLADAFALADDLGVAGRIVVGAGQDTVDLVANPIELSDTPAVYDRRPPRLGEHTDELRAWLRRPAPEPDPITQTPPAFTVNGSHP